MSVAIKNNITQAGYNHELELKRARAYIHGNITAQCLKANYELDKKYFMQLLFAKCSFSACHNKAEWVMGTWQCCDECAKKWITVTGEDSGFAVLWGTSKRIGQQSILAHNFKWNLQHYLVHR